MKNESKTIASQVHSDLPAGYTISAIIQNGECTATMWNADGVEYDPDWKKSFDDQLWECLVHALETERAKQA